MMWIYVAVFLFVSEIFSAGSENDTLILSRRKRYVAFPDGATIIFAFCMTAQTILPTGIFTEGTNWGIAYDLPNRTSLNEFEDKPKVLKRRHRRDLYNKAELVMDSMGFDGRSCIYRALCESSRLFLKNRIPTLSEELIRLLFKFPQQSVSEIEPEEHRLYHWAYRKGRENKQQDCFEMFPACSISLVDLALGYYNDYLEEPHYQSLTPDL